MRWFGKAYGAPYEADCEHAATPVGEACHWCREPILEGESGVLVPYMRKGPGLPHQVEAPYHYECHLRSVIGGANHLRRRCFCCGGTHPPDPPELSLREAAKMAVMIWHVDEGLRRLKRHDEGTRD